MRNKKWYVMIGVLIVAAFVSLYIKGRLVGGEVAGVQGGAKPPPITFDRGLPSLSGLVKDTKPSVVNISTTTVVRGIDLPGRFGNPFRDFFGNDEFFDKFFHEEPRREFKQKSLGSGVIIDKEGYILTNNHVVEKASSIRVKMSDGKEYDAKVIGKDAKTDIALIKVNVRNSLPVAVLGDSDALEVGDWVLAIGNPYGLDHTVTAGIVSAKGRVIGQGPYDDFIQTDASINPGNSGGPLFNLRGEVIGINTAIISGGQGIGFAIPINMAKALLPQLKNRGKVVRGWLGVVIQKVTPELAKGFGLKESEGALVSDVMEDSPASKAGIKRGDVIVSFDGKRIKEMDQLPRIVAATVVGKGVKVGLIRDGKPLEVEVTVAEGREEPREAMNTAPEVEKNFGLVVQNITPEIAHHLNLKDTKGVIVTDIQSGSPGDDADVKAGDVIKEINRKPVRNVDDFKEILGKARPKEGIVMLVKRENITFYAVVREGKSDR
jgi:serine protease Do